MNLQARARTRPLTMARRARAFLRKIRRVKALGSIYLRLGYLR